VDALKFLQNLTTNDVRRLAAPQDVQHTAFLDSKGRTLFESTLCLSAASTADLPEVLMEVGADQVQPLVAHLKRSRVRARAEIVDLSATHNVTSVVHADPFASSSSSPPLGVQLMQMAAALKILQQRAAVAARDDPTPTNTSSSSASAFLDPRSPLLGGRLLAPRDSSLVEIWREAASDIVSTATAPLAHFSALRALVGTPEGGEVAGLSPLEWSLPCLHGVSFAKGCYLGQENVARAHFRGAVRKRVLPVLLGPSGSPARAVACADPWTAAAAACASRGTDDIAAAPRTSMLLSLPFPHVDMGWVGGPVKPGTAILDEDEGGSGGGTSMDAADAVASGTDEEHGGSGRGTAGRIISTVPGANVGLALIRLSGRLGEVMMQQVPYAPLQGDPGTAAPADSFAVEEGASALEDCGAAATAAMRALHARAQQARPPRLLLAHASAGGGLRVSLLLPMFWWRVGGAGGNAGV